MMRPHRLIKRLGKKHIQLLEILSRGAIDTVASGRLQHVTRFLIAEGLISEDEFACRLTEEGKQLIERYPDEILLHPNQQWGSLVEALLPSRKLKTPVRRRSEEREDEILKLHADGLTLEEIGDVFGLTRQRIDQIIKRSPRYEEHLQKLSQQKLEAAKLKERDRRQKLIEKSLANRFPDEVDRYWDQGKNEGLDPVEIRAHSTSIEIWWKCPLDGHSWKRTPAQITSSWTRSGTSGCPVCAGKRNPPVRQSSLLDEFPEYVSRYWDTERNRAEGLDSSKITLASNRRIWLLCPVHNYSWQARVHSTVRQQWAKGNAGCRVCNGTLHRRDGKRGKAPALAERFPDEVEIYWDTEANEAKGLDPQKVTSGSSKSAHFVCPLDGYRWSATIAGINNSWSRGNSGCPACRGFEVTPQLSLNGLFPDFVERYWDFEGNSAIGLDPTEIGPGSKERAKFYCAEHTVAWSDRIRDITRGYWSSGRSGCTVCSPRRRKASDPKLVEPANLPMDLVPGSAEPDLLDMLGYYRALDRPSPDRHAILAYIYEVEMSPGGTRFWGEPKSATRRIKIVEALTTRKGAEDHDLTRERLMRDIGFVQTDFF